MCCPCPIGLFFPLPCLVGMGAIWPIIISIFVYGGLLYWILGKIKGLFKKIMGFIKNPLSALGIGLPGIPGVGGIPGAGAAAGAMGLETYS